MKSKIKTSLSFATRSLLFFLCVALLTQCGSVPITGRRQFLLVSDQQILGLSEQNYRDFIKKAEVDKSSADAQMVNRVGQRISSAVNRYLSQNGLESEVKNLKWEFNLVKSKTVNAFCMPGGKIVIYQGIIPVAQNETGLAIVMGHEVAHAIAKHSNERMSQQLLLQLGTAGAAIALKDKSPAVQQAAAIAFGLGTTVGVTLPFSRKQELEADDLGLVFAAMAGYNPEEGIRFWQRMAQNNGSSSSLDFLQTHPSSKKRIDNISKKLPGVMKYYSGANNMNIRDSSPRQKEQKRNNKYKNSNKWSF